MIKALIIISTLFLLSCSSDKKKEKGTYNRSCEIRDIYSKHAKIYAENNILGLKECLRNHIKLHKTAINFKVCNQVIINSQGKVTWAKVYGDKAPTDFKWCIEQSLWKSDFRALQINEKLTLKFPLIFEYQ
jgi:hypothetical protein